MNPFLANFVIFNVQPRLTVVLPFGEGALETQVKLCAGALLYKTSHNVWTKYQETNARGASGGDFMGCYLLRARLFKNGPNHWV